MSQSGQPAARKEGVRDTYFGTTIEDPYRWMEDWQEEEFKTWLKAQSDYTRSFLDSLPEREALLARIKELSNANPRLYSLQVAGGRTFYLKHDTGENLAKLIVRFTPTEAEKVLFDPNMVEGEAQTAIDWYYPSRDGQYVAYGLSKGGSENSTLFVLEVESGKTLDLAISRTSYTFVNWVDDRSFTYMRFPERPPDAPPAERYKDGATYLHRLGSDPEKDPLVLGHGVSAGVEVTPDDYPYLITSRNSDWMLGLIMHGDLNEFTLYAAPRTMLSEPGNGGWTKIVDVADAVTGHDFIGDTIYLKTHKDAPRYKVIATSLKNPDLAHAQVVVPEGTVVIEDIRVAGDYLLIRDLDGGIGRIRRIKCTGGEIESVPLPFEGTIREWTNEDASTNVIFSLSSWTVSPSIYFYDVETQTTEDTGWYPPFPVDFGEIEAREVQVAAKDGTLIPLSIIAKKGLKMDGNNPTLFTGYGSYGISLSPYFAPEMLAWYERGGVFAVAHMRGGGEYGKAWHLAGQGLNKQRTIDDFIACAEYLVAQKYTRPERLAGQGGSAGGIPSGGAFVQRPDLWAVMVMNVPVVNALRFEFTENGPPNIYEFGSVTTEDGFRGLQIIDSYSKVKEGVAYPAALLTAGYNDPRVVVWQAAKMAARVQAATTSDRPILLRVEYQGGHGMGSTRQQLNEEFADELAFLLQQMGVS